MLFRHPCDKCLVQACCTIACKKYREHNRITSKLPTFFIAISVVVCSYIVLNFIKVSPKWYISVFLILLFYLNSVMGCFSLAYHCDAKIDEVGFGIFLAIISPLVFISFLLEWIWTLIFEPKVYQHEERLMGKDNASM
jgi:hypothetical protein